MRSELSAELLNRCSDTLLAQGGALLIELCTAIIAVETMSAAALFAQIKAQGFEVPEGTTSLRAASSPSAPAVLMWCFDHQAQIPVHAIASVVKLVEIQFFLAMTLSAYGQAAAGMLFDWLLQLDVRETAIAIPSPADAPRLTGEARSRMIEDLRGMALLLAANAPEKAKAYLRAVAGENDTYKVKAIRPLSKTLAGVAPAELAALIEASLIEKPRKGRSRRESMGRVFGFADSDYMPASPAQPPFLDLLDADPQIGLALIRTLVAAAVDGHAEGKATETNGFAITVDGTPRFFPWVQTYFWSRQFQAPESSVGSALKALEAWSHERLDRGEDVATVLQDILGPEGSCAAYLVVAIDVLMSHWPATRDALVPFVANPHILASDRARASIEMAFARRRYRWHPYDEDPADKIAYESERARQDGEAISAEIAWLDGGPEPDWPTLPDERPSLRNRPRAILSRDRARIEFEQDEAEESWAPRSKKASIHVETQGIAKWLAHLNREACPRPAWFGEIVDTYAPWSARLNAHGYSADAELDRTPDDWNQQFYLLVAAVIMDAGQEQLDAILTPILELPDHSFCDVADTLTRAADACYFNDRGCPADRACTIRRQLVTRTMALDRWSWDRGPGELRIDFESGPTIGVMLMNEYNLVSSARSYLVPAVFDRIDPLLETLRPMMPGGPTAFIALCTMNTLLIGPTARHLDFLLFAIESWIEVTGGDRAMWHELAIGRKVAQWFESATMGDPSLYQRDHAQRLRIDAMLGRLVSLGVSEAHELELKIEAERNGPAQSLSRDA